MIRQRNLPRVSSNSSNSGEIRQRKDSGKEPGYLLAFWLLLMGFIVSTGGCIGLYVRNSSELSNLESQTSRSRSTVEELTERVVALNKKKNAVTKELETQTFE